MNNQNQKTEQEIRKSKELMLDRLDSLHQSMAFLYSSMLENFGDDTDKILMAQFNTIDDLIEKLHKNAMTAMNKKIEEAK